MVLSSQMSMMAHRDQSRRCNVLVASLIGRLGSSTFRLSTAAVSMSLAGSCFSSESALGPFHHGIRGRGGTIYWAALPSDERRSKRTCELTSSIVPRGTSFHHAVELEFPPIAFDPARFSCRCGFPGPAELGAVNPDNGMDRPRSNRVNGNAAEAADSRKGARHD